MCFNCICNTLERDPTHFPAPEDPRHPAPTCASTFLGNHYYLERDDDDNDDSQGSVYLHPRNICKGIPIKESLENSFPIYKCGLLTKVSPKSYCPKIVLILMMTEFSIHFLSPNRRMPDKVAPTCWNSSSVSIWADSATSEYLCASHYMCSVHALC